MWTEGINLIAIFVSGLFSLVLGFLWMSIIWAKPYKKHMYGYAEGDNSNRPNKATIIRSFVYYIIISFVTAYGYAISLNLWKAAGHVVGYNSNSFIGAFLFTLLIWAAYTLPFAIGKMTWQFKSWHVAAVDSSYELVRFILFLTVFWFWI